MDCLPVSKLPEGAEWTYDIKLDGYRLEAVRNTKEVTLYSRRQNVLNDRFGYIATSLEYFGCLCGLLCLDRIYRAQQGMLDPQI